MYNTTIVASATNNVRNAISVIRLSGENAVEISEKVFSKPLKKDRQVIYGKAKDSMGNIIDDLLCVKMLAPHSYTGEDTVEFYCHGGRTVSECLIRELISHGAVLAEKGEFTKRAFLNGKIDLTQAESVIDIINAKTKKSLIMSQNNLDGKLKNKINNLRNEVVNIITGIMAGNDFPDETGGNIPEEILTNIKNIREKISKLLNTYDTGRIIREGFSCAVCGKPNVGKSSLLNALLDEERAIVTDIAGTTRDVVTESVDIGGYIMNIADTAGIRESEDVIEKIGIEKSYEYIKAVDLVLYVSDLYEAFDYNELEKILKMNENVIVVFNKYDKAQEIPDISKYKLISSVVSAKNKSGIIDLMETIKNYIEEKFSEDDGDMIFSERHYEALSSSLVSMDNAITSIENLFEPDIVSIDLENTAMYLGEITGQTVNEEVVDNIFKNFCIGK